MHKFDPAKFDDKKAALAALNEHRKQHPNPANIPALAERVRLLERVLCI